MKLKQAFSLFFILFIKCNSFSQTTKSDSLWIYFNGIYIYELKCGDDFQYDSLVKNGVSLKNSKSIFKVDSMVAHVFYKFGEEVPYFIKGNKLPKQFAKMVKNREYGVSIWIEKLYYKEDNKMVEVLNNNIIVFCNFNNSPIKDFKTK